MSQSNNNNDNSNNTNTQIDYTTSAPRFSVKNEDEFNAGIAYLNEHGYAVISDIMDENEIDVNKDLLWKFLENFPDSRIQRNDPETWSNEWPTFSTHGVINGKGIGQSDFLWNVRSNRLVKKVFDRLWNNQPLLVSFDGCGVFRDWRYNSTWKTNGGWNHVDQNPIRKPEQCCIQGFVSLTDQNQTTGGLIVYPRTHLTFTQLTDLTKRTDDFIIIPHDHPIIDPSQTRGKLVHCKAGDLVLWDSRTVHCNSPAVSIEERNEDEGVDLLRIVAYVCMIPTKSVGDETIKEFREKRKEIVENNVTLTHWPSDITKSHGRHSNLPKISIDKFNDYQKALIFGFEINNEA